MQQARNLVLPSRFVDFFLFWHRSSFTVHHREITEKKSVGSQTISLLYRKNRGNTSVPGRKESLKTLMFPAVCMVNVPGWNCCRRINERSDNGWQFKRGTIMKMTNEQKQEIETLRRQGIGYCTVAKRVGLPANTVKTFCRRNNLSSAVLSDGAPARKPQAGTSVQTSAKQIQMKKESGNYSSTGKSSAECEVTLSFSTNPDMSAVEDVMAALMNSRAR